MNSYHKEATNQPRCSPARRLAAAFGLVVLSVAPLAAVEPNPNLKLNVDVIQGEGAEHDIHAPREIDITVAVSDTMQNAIQGAVVVFQLPQSGPGGTFLNESRFATVITNDMGLATAQGLRTNGVPGEFAIVITVSYRDYQSVTLNVKQRNVDSSINVTRTAPPVQEKKKGGGGKIAAIVALIGGAAAGAALGLAGGGGSSVGPSPQPPPPGAPPTTITPGSPTFGAPR